MTKIKHEPGDSNGWICECGNTPCGDGFIECDAKGREMEPVSGKGWSGLYICNGCGLIINQSTREIVGQGIPPHKLETALVS